MKPDFGTTSWRPVWVAESWPNFSTTLAARLASEERFGGRPPRASMICLFASKPTGRPSCGITR